MARLYHLRSLRKKFTAMTTIMIMIMMTMIMMMK